MTVIQGRHIAAPLWLRKKIIIKIVRTAAPQASNIISQNDNIADSPETLQYYKLL